MEAFPRWKYRGSQGVIVQNEDEERALGAQWGNVPGYGGTGTAHAVKVMPPRGREELLEQAANRGIKVDRRWSASRLAREIQAHTEG